MQIVIDIYAKQYEIIKELVKKQNSVCPEADSAEKIILKGIPLPNGHGRLIDADEVIKIANKTKDLHGAIWNTPTIIEDKGDKDVRFT